MILLVGVISMDRSFAGVTVSVVDPDMLPDVAVAVVSPVADALASPSEPEELLMEAVSGEEDVQTTEAVISWVELSE